MESKTSPDQIDQLLARRRERLGGPVSLDEIFMLHDASQGEIELSEEERSQLLDRVSADPAGARQLLELLRFPSQAAPLDDPGAVEARWAAFRDRFLRSASSSQDQPVPSSSETNTEALPKPPPMWMLPWRWSTIASFALGILLMLVFNPPWKPDGIAPTEPSVLVNLPIVELVAGDTGTHRGTGTLRLPDSADGLVLTLATRELEASKSFTLMVSDASNRYLQRIEDLKPGPGGVFVVTLPRQLLLNGNLHLRLEDDNEPVEEFLLQISSSP